MKKIILFFILILNGCSDDMDDSSLTERILEDKSTTLREKLSSLTLESQLWFNETSHNRLLEGGSETYIFEKFFQDGYVRQGSYAKLKSDFSDENNPVPCYQIGAQYLNIDQLFIKNEDAFSILYTYHSGQIDHIISIENGVLSYRNNASNGPFETIYKQITPEQLALKKQWSSEFPKCIPWLK